MAKNIFKFLIAALLGCGVMYAQEARVQPLVPDNVIKLEIKFDGPNADKITAVYGNMSTQDARPPDQAGFTNNISGEYKLISPGTFQVEFKIEPTTMSGNYTLPNLDVRAPGIQLNYSNGQQYHLRMFRIENSNKFAQPSVSIKEIH